ncbi:probable protein phosphatase CG10417 isoform X1 [Schistocerca cancellata]|uniref:probable protein phosphatase CG10417 isoform X1 n=1 Tax=Schistocerca cancellata TaxID=274614 RepID=UPI0021190344|nr:probable protein phosphatase CG10417 isoform X1 [Schistocerca cancellata]
MGAYLSEPITEKVSTDETGKRVKCGASSMQGWRVSQEDAHNCLINFDKNDTSFFAVYDGHGGHEVAQYCAQNLPEFLKTCEAYKKGDYVQALKDAFLGFDATLREPEVIAILKQIVKGKEESGDNSASEDEENVKNLFAEAEMPLEQVMAKYRRDMISSSTKKLKDGDDEIGDYPDLDKENIPEASGSGTAGIKLTDCESDTDANSSDSQEKPSADGDSAVVSDCDANHKPTSSNGNGDSETEPHSKTDSPDVTASVSDKNKEPLTGSDTETAEELKVKEEMNGEHNVNDGDQGAASGEPQGKSSNVTGSEAPVKNGEVSVSEDKDDTSTNEDKGKRKAMPNFNQCILRKSLRQHAAVALYHSLLGGQDQSDSDSDEADESFKAFDRSIFGLFGRFFYICKLKIFSIIKFLIPIGIFNFHLSSEDEEGESEKGEEAEEDLEDEEDEEEEEQEQEEGDDEDDDDDSLDADDEEEDFGTKVTEEPGSDSGCTAVVALLKGQELYVANAGDSRCVVCRNGQAVEMSLDHKPEDECELERIEKAGGKVTTDGRVNGGLNLSRAIGDHAYKQAEKLPPEEQMITALPDVRTLMIDPKEDEFMVLACDGIWNFMSSQDVVDFVRPRILENPEKLSHICEELFDHCLAPSTVGDGTGCDNMTAVIVQFLSADASSNEKSGKRCLSPRPEEESVKRPKTEEVSTV